MILAFRLQHPISPQSGWAGQELGRTFYVRLSQRPPYHSWRAAFRPARTRLATPSRTCLELRRYS